MLTEQRPGIQPTERPKLSSEGKPIIRILDFTTTSILKCDLFPYARSTIHRPADENGIREDFAALLVNKAKKHNELNNKEPRPLKEEISKTISNISKKAEGINLDDPSQTAQLADLFEFVTEIGDPREVDRPFSEEFTLSKTIPRKVINKDAVLRYLGSGINDLWGSFYIIADRSLKILRDEQIKRGLKPNNPPGIIGSMDFHLSYSRPRFFLGWQYEISIQESSESHIN